MYISLNQTNLFVILYILYAQLAFQCFIREEFKDETEDIMTR